MNEPHWEHLINGHLDDSLSESERADFESLMLESASARKLFWELAEVHGLARDAARVAWGEPDGLPPAAAQRKALAARLAWFRWNPLTAAAAGLVFGIFSASVVWAYAVPLAGRPMERTVAVLAEGFEDPQLAPGRGFPTGANRWSGDLSVPVGTEAAVIPSEGSHMVRLTHPPKRRLGYAWWIVDLGEHPEAATAGPLRLQVAASFNTPGPARASRYQIRLAAFSEEPADVRAIWNNEPVLFDTVLQHVGRNVLTKPGDTGWQTVHAVMEIPPGTRSVVISLAAGEADSAPPLAEHYLDNVQVRFIVTQTPTE